MGTYALLTLLAALVFGATWLGGHRAAAQARAGGVDVTRADLIHGLRVERDRVTHAYERRCRPAPGYGHHPSEFGRARLERGIRSRLRALHNIRELRTICNQERKVIRLVFGPAAYMAERVAECESGMWRYAHNPSGASGLFQLMPFHWQGRFNPYHTLRNAEYAYRLSGRGYDWGPWVCRP